MKREIYAKLLEWKSRRDHKPLVLDGARQVGKTYIDEHPALKGLRVSMKNYIDQGWMENLPLYAIEGYLRAEGIPVPVQGE